ncbi:hypothetical protein Cni_G18628 [Canna indica]|uniref:Uncharacterized protein n=1 Tax=Canna indica TaxID=4628 RepID=A0AAQ3KL22_9LILI|nr:hypothetical protein Cni_G18628 [Canna indica]
MKNSLVVVFTLGLLTIFSKTNVEGRQLERSLSDFSLQGAKGKEYLILDNKFAFSSNNIDETNNEENKIHVNNHKNKAKVARDPSFTDLFEDEKTSYDGRIRNRRIEHK